MLFARFCLGKDVTPRMWKGTAVIVCGVVITVMSASVVPTLTATSSDLMELWTRTSWHLYLGFSGTFALLNEVTHRIYASLGKRFKLPAAETVEPMSYASSSAVFGTLSVVQAKVLSELLTAQMENTENIFWSTSCWFTYATLAGWLVLTGIWLNRMEKAMGLYDPMFIIPCLQVNFIVFAIIR